MYLLHRSSLLILGFLIILPISSSAPTTDATDPEVTVDCQETYPIPGQPSWYHIAPFPSHCRSLANHLQLLPDSHILAHFDQRLPASGAAGRRIIPVPYSERYESCIVFFFPPQNPAPGSNPNLARYAGFASMIRFSIKTCFDVLPEQSEGHVAAFGTYAGRDGNAWTAVLTGPVVRPRSTGSNATVLDGGLSSSMNGSLTLVEGGGDGTSAQGTVDVT